MSTHKLSVHNPQTEDLILASTSTMNREGVTQRHLCGSVPWMLSPAAWARGRFAGSPSDPGAHFSVPSTCTDNQHRCARQSRVQKCGPFYPKGHLTASPQGHSLRRDILETVTLLWMPTQPWRPPEGAVKSHFLGSFTLSLFSRVQQTADGHHRGSYGNFSLMEGDGRK